jgi:uncharacterized protein (TIGR02452 family)
MTNPPGKDVIKYHEENNQILQHKKIELYIDIMEHRANQLHNVLTRFDRFKYSPLYPTVRWKYDKNFTPIEIHDESEVIKVKKDSLECAKKLTDPLLLIASDNTPGGDFQKLSKETIEELLFMKSALWRHLTVDLYPIKQDSALYCKDVSLLTGEIVSFLAVSSIKKPKSLDNRLNNTDVEVLEKKIELIHQVAIQTGHNNLIIGSLGCDVYGCPPRHVSEIWKKVLQKYKNTYKKVVFAILGENYNQFSI